MRRAAWMHHQFRVGQLRHQRTGTTCMVQVHMGHHHPVDVRRRQAGRGCRGQQVGHRVVGTAIDECTTTLLHDQVGRIEVVTLESGVDGMDAVLAHLRARSCAKTRF